MKSEVKKIDATKRQVSVEVSEAIVKQKFEEVFKKITKEAKISGFRPGTTPRDIIEKNFSAEAHQMVLKELIPDMYDKAIEKEGIQAVDLPEISDVKLDRSSLSFKATVEVSPQISLKNYKGLKVAYKKIEAQPDEVKRHIEILV